MLSSSFFFLYLHVEFVICPYIGEATSNIQFKLKTTFVIVENIEKKIWIINLNLPLKTLAID